MTIKIKLDALRGTAYDTPEAFARAVDQHAAAMLEYMEHLKGVEADAMNEDIRPEDRRVAFPPPDPGRIIELAAAEGYEIVGPSLDEKKAVLFAEVKRVESEALQAIIPPAKARHWAFQEADIHAADQERYKAQLAMPVSNPMPFDQFSLINRPLADTTFLKEQADRKALVESAMRSAARLEYSIDNLTEETIDGWTMDVAEAFK